MKFAYPLWQTLRSLKELPARLSHYDTVVAHQGKKKDARRYLLMDKMFCA